MRLSLAAKNEKKIKHSTFGTRNQNNPTHPCVYAFSDETKSAGAQIHAAAIEKAAGIFLISRFATRKPSLVKRKPREKNHTTAETTTAYPAKTARH